MPLEKGRLVLSKKGKPLIEIDGKQFSPARGELSQSLLANLKESEGKEVEFERVGGQPKKVREVGGSFIQPQLDVGASDRDRRRPDRGRGSPKRRPQEPEERTKRDIPQQRDFHNPYNFVPAPPRNTSDLDLGDWPPIDQDAFFADRYSGSIRVRMIAKTPLLVPDTERAQESTNGHKTFPLRVGPNGKPLIPASSVRGMLRAAYEAATNSRFGRFPHEQHGDRLAFRMDARDGLRLIPARVENGEIRLLTGTSGVGSDGKPSGPMYAAWLPRYNHGQIANWAVRYIDGSLPAHGDEVVCWVEPIQHSSPNFSFWRVREVARGSELTSLGPQPSASQPRGKTAPANPTEMRRVHGWVCITNANIDRKHDERVFFRNATNAPGPFPVTEQHRQTWQELIQNYQSIHAEDLRKRRNRNQRPDESLGSEPGQTAWSRHVYTKTDQNLTDGTLCYVRLNADQSDVEALFPVMIARELYPTSPWNLLHDSLRPATKTKQLSPADRVFGWVKADTDTGRRLRGERVAARGLLRVGPVRCESSTSEAIEQFEPPGVPLAILSTPKPQQGRFYVARSLNGEAQRDGLSKKDAGYALGKGLRGRKVYPHQRSLPDGHWDAPTEDRTQKGQGTPAHWPRDRNGEEQCDDQNRSILGWIKPGAEFSFDLHVQNLSAVELGALLWLLDLPEGCFFRFGGGKPIGFGSVRLDIESCDLRTGSGLRERYSSWLDGSPPGDPRQRVVDEFWQAVTRAYPPPSSGSFEDVAFIRAFLRACKGHDDNLPTHYPRATKDGQPGPPSPDGESFRWFVANERDGARYALPDLVTDTGLPTLSDNAKRGGSQKRGR